jgi:protein-tyrosine-phosphatase
MKKRMGGLILGLAAAVGVHAGDDKRAADVVFVCEHGAAKSVVAAAHFNRLARERGLRMHAIARGTVPDERLAPVAVRGLVADGLKAPEGAPELVRAAEIAGARRTVALGCDVSRVAPAGARVDGWDEIPPMSADYAAARAAIVKRVKALLDDLEAAQR